MTAHGTPLTGAGSPDVLIGGMPAWRAGVDVHSCPLFTGATPHVGGPVVVGSPTVLVNGHPAARVGDAIAESGPPNTVASGEPTVLLGDGASAVDPPWIATLNEELSAYVRRYNEAIIGSEPGIGQEQLQNERVNLHVATDEGEAAFSFRIDGRNRIRSFQRGPRDDATVRMETDRDTVERIGDADRPGRAFRTALIEDEIAIRGIGTVNAIRWTVIGVLEEIGELVDLV